MTTKAKLNRLLHTAGTYLSAREHAQEADAKLKTESERLLHEMLDCEQTSIDDFLFGDTKYKLTRVDAQSVSIDLDALSAILTPSQRKKVLRKVVKVDIELDQEALNDLINSGEIVPNSVPYIIKSKAPYIKVTAQK